MECKADPKDHVSEACKDAIAGKVVDESREDYAKRVQRYAVDGSLHYAAQLSKEFDVVAVAVSGESKAGATITTHLHAKGASGPRPLKTKGGAEVNRPIPWDDYIEHATFDPSVQRLRLNELMEFSQDLHDFMRDHCKLTESGKPLMVSGTLIALRNKAFAKSYEVHAGQSVMQKVTAADEWCAEAYMETDYARISREDFVRVAKNYVSFELTI